MRSGGNPEFISWTLCNLGDCGESNGGSHACQRCRCRRKTVQTCKTLISDLEGGLPSCRGKPSSMQSSANAKEPTGLWFTDKGSATRWTPGMVSTFCGPIVSSFLIAATTYIKKDTERDFSIQTSSAHTWAEMSSKHFMDERNVPL